TRGPHQHLRPRDFALAIRTCCRKGVTRLIEEHHTAGRAQRDEGIVLNITLPDRVAGDRGYDRGLLAGNVAAKIKTVEPQIEQRAAAGLRLGPHPRIALIDVALDARLIETDQHV